MRGKDPLVSCGSCGRSVPRSKAVQDNRKVSYSTELRTGDDVSFTDFRKVYYCISCAKHRKIFEKKKRQAMSKYNR
ncbi:MAG: hypothetical protein N3H30_01720 [Candidatus Micrarchaeota archaeon]|nr:hypothetical protein [Candidatus Micrarchaeota archaeon]